MARRNSKRPVPRSRAQWLRMRRGLAQGVTTAALSLVCLWVLARLGQADLRFPLAALDGDALSTQAIVFKGLVDNGWFLDNKWLAAPFGANVRDFAGPDVLILAAVKFVTLFTNNHLLVRNIIAIASYPAVALTSLYVMRRMGVRHGIALAASLLYAFISFHQHRIGAHIFLAIGYFTVPLATFLSIRLYENEPLLVVAAAGRPGIRFLTNQSTWVALAWCVIMGLSGSVYYTFFSCYFFAMAGALGALRVRSLLPLVRAAGLGLVATAAMLAGMFPLLWQRVVHGASNSIIRSPEGAETFALKISQLVIPGGGHRLPALQRLAEYYNRTAPLVNENSTAYLGAFGVLGFGYLLYLLLKGEQDDLRLRSLSLSNILAILLATIGGFSSLIGFLVSDQIRSYNRISVFIAFFALLVLAIVAERFTAKYAATRLRRAALASLLFVLTLVGLYDQYPMTIDYAKLKKDYAAEAAFIRRIERALPANSAIFQYPYFPFPEHGPMGKLHDYAEFWPYLHSKKLRWSYGAVKGRREAAWQANIAGLAPDQAVDALAQAGFAGILVSRNGYADRAKGLEEGLRVKLGSFGLTSTDGNTAFYSILDRAAQLRQEQGPQEFERRRAEVLTPVYLGWLGGCYPPLRGRIWCRAKGHFVIDNPSPNPIHLVLEAKVGLATEPPASLHLRSDIFNRDLKLTKSSFSISEGFDVPPGEHIFTVTPDAPEVVDEARRKVALVFESAHLDVIVRSSSFDHAK